MPILPPLPAPRRLQAFDAYLRELTTRLDRRIEDLEDVKALVAVLREVGGWPGVEGMAGRCRASAAAVPRCAEGLPCQQRTLPARALPLACRCANTRPTWTR